MIDEQTRRDSIGSTTHKQELLFRSRSRAALASEKTLKFKILRVMRKINNRITNLDLKRANLDLQKAKWLLKKTSIDDHEAPDLTHRRANQESKSMLKDRVAIQKGLGKSEK